MGEFFVYILQNWARDRYYVGFCKDLEKRLVKHNNGLVRSTKFGCPWKVVYTEAYGTRQEAYRRERQIKSYKGGEAFKKLITNNRAVVYR